MPVPVKPSIEDHHSEHHVRLHERVFEGKGLLIAGANIYISVSSDGQYIISARPAPSAPSGIIWPPVIYDVTAGYAQGQAVWVQAADTLTTTGAVYPGTGLTALSKAGLWIAVKAAPAGYFPVAPYPSPDDPTAATMYWLYFGNLYC